MKNTDFSYLDILARSMSIWDTIRYDKEKKRRLITNLRFTKFSDVFLVISVLLYASLAFQTQWLMYVPPGLILKNFTLCEQSISIW